MVMVAMEPFESPERRLVDDELALSFLPKGARRMIGLARWRPLRHALVATSEAAAPGAWGGILCRKKYMDQKLSEAIAAGLDSLVILGSGFDTRACRVTAPSGIPGYEIDLPENIAAKRKAIEAVLGRVPDEVALIPFDFETADLSAALADRGLRHGGRTLFIWEGVTQYLSEQAMRRTLASLSSIAGPGSRLAFTYVLGDFIAGAKLYGSEKLYRRFVEGYRIWHYGLMPAAVSGFLAEYGWTECEQFGRAEYIENYLKPIGRHLAVMEIERACLAEKR
jgi:methyltransferase (TIGR00027 family)